MKTAIIIADGIKQIMFTPENDAEKKALKMFSLDDNITMDYKRGTFFGNEPQPESAAAYSIQECQGGYMRAYQSTESLMLVLKPKQEEKSNNDDIYNELTTLNAYLNAMLKDAKKVSEKKHTVKNTNHVEDINNLLMHVNKIENLIK